MTSLQSQSTHAIPQGRRIKLNNYRYNNTPLLISISLLFPLFMYTKYLQNTLQLYAQCHIKWMEKERFYFSNLIYSPYSTRFIVPESEMTTINQQVQQVRVINTTLTHVVVSIIGFLILLQFLFFIVGSFQILLRVIQNLK